VSEAPHQPSPQPEQPQAQVAPAGKGNGTILEVEDIHTYYGAIHALKGITLEVREGEIVTLIGANGAGKSTTLRSINGLNHPRLGSIRFQGRDITNDPPHRIVAMGVAQSPEGRKLFPRMSVLENLEMGRFQMKDRSTFKEDLERVYSLFPRLAERKTQKAGTLSGGEQQMVAMGRALMLDEPSMGPPRSSSSGSSRSSSRSTSRGRQSCSSSRTRSWRSTWRTAAT
jgi:branched-chain amino acid transport system ATP-binding protein